MKAMKTTRIDSNRVKTTENQHQSRAIFSLQRIMTVFVERSRCLVVMLNGVELCRNKTVGAQDAAGGGLLAVEVKRGVHDVLERLGPRDVAALGDVAHEEHRDAERLLAHRHQRLGALPHLHCRVTAVFVGTAYMHIRQ